MPVVKPDKSIRINSGYSSEIYNPRKLIRDAKKILNHGEIQFRERSDGRWGDVEVSAPEFDTIVGTGLSGTLHLTRLATALDCNWLAIRKKNDSNHADELPEGLLGRKWIFFDDFIGVGSTFQRVARAVTDIAEKRDFETEFVGAYLYSSKKKLYPLSILPELVRLPSFLAYERGYNYKAYDKI